MANQYTGSFEHIVREKYQCSARELLEQCVDEGMSYADAEERFGFKHGTIRKWAKKFGLKLHTGTPQHNKEDQLRNLFNESRLNRYNILSRSWFSGNHFRI